VIRDRFAHDRLAQTLATVVVVVFTVLGAVAYVRTAAACEARGGVYVRTFWWFDCVEKR
jgi:hypothetical protein